VTRVIVWGGDAAVVGLAALTVFAGAALIAWGRAASLGRWLLAVGTMVGLFALAVLSVRRGADPYGSLATALAGVLAFGAFWSVALEPVGARVQAALGALAALTMAGLLVAPLPAVGAILGDMTYNLSGWSYVAGAGVLVAGLARDAAAGDSAPTATPYLSLATLCLTVALAAQGAATQWAWGTYWMGDPLECLHLAGWIAVALGGVIAEEFPRHPRAVVGSLWMAAGIVIAVLLGATPLIQALGLPGLHLVS